MYKAEIELRSSMEKRSLMERRASYRRGRRYRKVRFRHPKWKCKTIRKYHKEPDKKGRHWQKESRDFMSDRREGWLPPSIQSKIDHHIEWIKRYLNSLPDNTKLVIEVARFDMARMKNPDIHGELYQKGPQYDYENVKAYVFDRDEYKCRICNTKAGTQRKDGTVVKIYAHHILYKSKGATDNPDYMATVCDCCHSAENHAPGGILYQWMVEEKKFARGYRDATFMNILRKRLYEEFPNAIFTYGNITTADRKMLKLDKSHANDAVAVSLVNMDITSVKDISNAVYIKQVRQKKRSLHEAIPRKGRNGKKNITAIRNSKNAKSVKEFHLWDKVKTADGQIGYISGFTGTSAYIQDKNNNYITPAGKNYKQHTLSSLHRIHPTGNWLITTIS